PERTVRPSGEKATVQTESVWPSRRSDRRRSAGESNAGREISPQAGSQVAVSVRRGAEVTTASESRAVVLRRFRTIKAKATITRSIEPMIAPKDQMRGQSDAASDTELVPGPSIGLLVGSESSIFSVGVRRQGGRPAFSLVTVLSAS